MSRSKYACLACAVAVAVLGWTAESAPVVTLVRVPNGGIQPDVLRDSRGAVHMLYFSGEPANGDLFYVRSTDDGRTFSRPVRVNSQPGSAIASGTIRGGQMALGRDGRVHVAWNGSGIALPKGPVDKMSGKAGSAMLYSRSNVRGTTFEPQRAVMQNSVALDGGGAVAADAQGTVYVLWHGNAADTGNTGEEARRVFAARSTDDGQTFAAETAAWSEPTGACSCCGLQTMATKAGELLVLFRSATGKINRDIYLLASGDRGRTFRGARVDEWDIEACPMTSMSLAEGNAGVAAAWESDGRVLFGPVDLRRPGVTRVIPAAGQGQPRKHPRLAFGAADTMLMVWTEGTAWARGGSVGWQLFDSAGKALAPNQAKPGVPMWSFAAPLARPDGTFAIFY
jgi:hypothetical protein